MGVASRSGVDHNCIEIVPPLSNANCSIYAEGSSPANVVKSETISTKGIKRKRPSGGYCGILFRILYFCNAKNFRALICLCFLLLMLAFCK